MINSWSSLLRDLDMHQHMIHPLLEPWLDDDQLMMPSEVSIILEHNLFIQLMENVSPIMININYQDISAIMLLNKPLKILDRYYRQPSCGTTAWSGRTARRSGTTECRVSNLLKITSILEFLYRHIKIGMTAGRYDRSQARNVRFPDWVLEQICTCSVFIEPPRKIRNDRTTVRP